MTELDQKALNSAQSTDPEAEREKYKAQIRKKNQVTFTDTWQAIEWDDIMAERPPVSYIIDGMIEKQSLNIVYGAPGCFKSFVLADMAVCVASGKPWLDSKQTKPFSTNKTGVIWVDYDNGARRTMDRVKSLSLGHNIETKLPIHVYCNQSPPLRADNETDIKNLAERVKFYDAGLVIVDNVGVTSGDADENSADMAAVMAHYRWLAESTQTAVILIHHQRKGGANGNRSGDALRGHSSIEASLDLALWVERDQGSNDFTINPTKARGAAVYPFSATFREIEVQGKELIKAKFEGIPCTIETEYSLLQWVCDVLADCSEPVNQSSFIELLTADYSGDKGMGVNKARKLIVSLENAGKIKVIKGANNAKLYSI